MKSATRRVQRHSTTSSGFPDDEDAFGGTSAWPDGFGSTTSNNDPWTSSNEVAQAWPSQEHHRQSSGYAQQRQQPPQESTTSWPARKSNNNRPHQLQSLDWTSGATVTDASGFPTDPFVETNNHHDSKWPSPRSLQKQQQQEEMPQRMSDEDWLPAISSLPTGRRTVVSSEQASTWGSVAQGRSEESDDWHTDPLSFSQDGGGGGGGGADDDVDTDVDQRLEDEEPPRLGTEARPIALEDYALEEREADLLKQAQKKKRQDPPAKLVATTSRVGSHNSSNHNTTMQAKKNNSESPVEDEKEFIPRKGIMRLFGGVSRSEMR